MNNNEWHLTLVQYWWSKAEESLYSAMREFKAESYNFAMNRIYYSAFYGVRSLFFKKGLSFKKHSGVRSAFHREFIKTGLVEIKYGKFYDQLFEDRQEGDYIAFVSFEPDYVEYQLKRSAEFLDILRPMI
jgi:uncharacterized protein